MVVVRRMKDGMFESGVVRNGRTCSCYDAVWWLVGRRSKTQQGWSNRSRMIWKTAATWSRIMGMTLVIGLNYLIIHPKLFTLNTA